MPIPYSGQLKGRPGCPVEEKKFYGSVKSKGRVNMRDISKRIVEATALTRAEVIGVIESLLDVIPDELSRGNTVRLGEFGNFRVSIKTEGKVELETLSTNDIINRKVIFSPGKEFKEKINTFTFEKISAK